MSVFLFVDFGQVGGVAETVATVACELEGRGHQVTVLAVHDGPATPTEYARRAAGPPPPAPSILRWAQLGWRMYRRATRTRPRPDVVAIEGRRLPPLVLAVAARMRRRSVVLVSPHNLASKRARGLRAVDEVIIRAACRLAHAVVLFDVPSADAGAYGQKALEVPLPPPSGALRATTNPRPTAGGAVPRAGTPGHIRGDKGIVSFAEALARSDLQVTYEVRGVARDRVAVAELAANDDERIVVLPLNAPMSSQVFYEHLSGLDVIVLPYRRVTASSVLQSALALGVPVAAFPFPAACAAEAEQCAVFTTRATGDDGELLAVVQRILGMGRSPEMVRRLARGVEFARDRTRAAADCYEAQAASPTANVGSLGTP
ncbi:MAG: glycosyltransferase [Acidimicrobiales bacterium]